MRKYCETCFTAVLRLAEDDPVLDEMLLEVDSISQAEDGVIASPDQLLLARGFLSTLRAESQDRIHSWLLDGSLPIHAAARNPSQSGVSRT